MFLAIVPAYNEEKNIASVVSLLHGVVDRVVVVDDGSKDETSTQAKKVGAVVLRHSFNRGQGAALETGHVYARQQQAEMVLHFDGDGQFHVDDIMPAREHLIHSGADVLFGSRFLHAQEQIQIPWSKRRVLHPIAKRIDRMMGGVVLSDVHNGFRLLTRHALHTIVLNQDGMAHASEIPQLVKKHGLTYVEFPIKVSYAHYGQRASKGIEIVKDVVLGRFI